MKNYFMTIELQYIPEFPETGSHNILKRWIINYTALRLRPDIRLRLFVY